jgi:hypothetical protein
MSTLAITPKTKKEEAFLIKLFKKMNIKATLLSDEEAEDAGLLLLMKEADTNDIVSEEEILRILG